MKRRVRAVEDRSIDVTVGTIQLDARPLVTIGPDHEFWTASPTNEIAFSKEMFTGAIVRVRPPANVSDEYLASAERFLAIAGAAKVRFESRAQADIVPAVEESHVHETIRETVMAMTETSRRRDELVALLDEKLSKVKL